MRVKGAESKKVVFNKILEVFPGSFMVSDKELRIPMSEYGEPLEIKVALTRAKDILGGGSAKAEEQRLVFEETPTPTSNDPYEIAPTADEKRSIEKMLRALGMLNE